MLGAASGSWQEPPAKVPLFFEFLFILYIKVTNNF